ncbi:hypothetical protein RHMOL_Rhmol13G0219800 [Rhododendron molle]|uniref:Uncharacterized protein n=1 Tax=Rhododendron molle TaxID=49168 RepID=A0ACC0LAD9_RHOML|nr:hypothetical protein RHMOL_Rhmol13G0219800 [Rhododendron molle]
MHRIVIYNPSRRSSEQGMGLIIFNRAIPFLEVLILFFSCFLSKFGIAVDTITSTQPITDPESIISSNNGFQLGFFSPINTTNRYVGIWYSSIPLRTVVWVANRDRPLTDSSGTMIISDDGNLLILSGQKKIIWSSNVSNPIVNSSAQLLDSGNLVIRDDSDGRTIWESFQYPSDSFLQRMKLGSDVKMKSWKSSSDPSVGTFSAGLNCLTIPEIYVWNGSHPYWRSGPWNGQIFIGVPYMNSMYLNGFTVIPDDNKGTAYVSFTTGNVSLMEYYLLNHDGNLMQKETIEWKREWEVSWSALETDCDVYGKCGPFGSCNSKDSPICSCLRGFEPNNIEEWNRENFTGGCARRTPLQCERNGSSNLDQKDGFLKLTTMKVPELADWVSVPENECEKQCLMNCSCAAYAYYQGIGCMSWSGKLVDIQKFSSDGADLYIRVAYSEIDKKRNMKFLTPVSVIIGSIIMAICAYFAWTWMAKQKGMTKKRLFKLEKQSLSPEYSTETSFEDNMNQVKLEELPLFKFEKLAIATGNFDENNKLGQGGFGLVYKGKLHDGQEIAVKRLSRSSKQGLEEFMNEVVVISKLQHRNLVRLLGCCVEGDEKILIYEYMPNKSLDAFLFG